MKIAMVINKELPAGLIANAAAVLGISLGCRSKDIVGADIQDEDGYNHMGITTKTIPMLGGTRAQIKEIRDKLFDDAYADITVIDFSEVAQKCLDYESYIDILSHRQCSDIYYLGICLYGPEKKVNKLTGFLGLLR